MNANLGQIPLMKAYKELNISPKEFTELSIKEKFDKLNIKTSQDFYKWNGKLIPYEKDNYKYQFFYDNEFDECVKICSEIERNNRPKVIKKTYPPLVLDIPECITEDFKHFKLDINYVKRNKTQDRLLNIQDMNCEKLFKDKKIQDNFNEEINITEKLYNEFIEDNKIYDIELYEFLLFRNIIIYNREEYFSEEEEEINMERVDLFYKNEFRPYMFDKYNKEIKEVNQDDLRKLKSFDYFYKKVNPNQYKKKDNNREYMTYSKNKSNLKKSYKMYLEGKSLDDIPIADKLKYIIFIIDNCDTNN